MSVPTSTPARNCGALGLHLLQPPVEALLLHLELGDAVAQQPADPVGPLEHHDVVPDPGQLLGRGQPGRPGADHRHPLAGAVQRTLRGHPALVPGPVDDLDLDLLDGHRVAVDGQHAGRLARRRAQRAGELREVVGGVQPLDGLPPVAAGRPGRSTPGSGCPAGSPGGRTGCRSSCSARPASPGDRAGSPRRPRASPRRRRSTGRRLGSSRGVVRNPLGSPMGGLHDRFVDVAALALGRLAGEHAPA